MVGYAEDGKEYAMKVDASTKAQPAARRLSDSPGWCRKSWKCRYRFDMHSTHFLCTRDGRDFAEQLKQHECSQPGVHHA